MWDRRARCEWKILGQPGHLIVSVGVAPSSMDSALGACVVGSVALGAAGCTTGMVASAIAALVSSVRAPTASFIARPALSKAATTGWEVGGSSADTGSAAGASMVSARAAAATPNIGPRLVKCRCWCFCSCTMALSTAWWRSFSAARLVMVASPALVMACSNPALCCTTTAA